MSEGIKKYIMISATILSVIFNAVMCWLFNFHLVFVIVFSYLIGFINGMIIIGITNIDD